MRIVSNPVFSTDALQPADASRLLGQNLEHPRHEFWPDEIPVSEALAESLDHLQGHRQLTDAYLMALARRHGATLASFDGGLRTLAGRDQVETLELVATAPPRPRRS